MFDVPFPAFYVGIAASSGKSPEGILSRIRKHRVKLTSSHIGVCPDKHGGVDHTGGWREFAIQRVRHFHDIAIADNVDDACLSFGNFVPSAGPSSHKKEAEWFESQLSSREGWLVKILNALWPDKRPDSVFLLTKGKSSGSRPEMPLVMLWDGTQLSA